MYHGIHVAASCRRLRHREKCTRHPQRRGQRRQTRSSAAFDGPIARRVVNSLPWGTHARNNQPVAANRSANVPRPVARSIGNVQLRTSSGKLNYNAKISARIRVCLFTKLGKIVSAISRKKGGLLFPTCGSKRVTRSMWESCPRALFLELMLLMPKQMRNMPLLTC